MKGLLQEFQKFVMRGNILDLAVAVILGLAFGAIVTSLVNDIIMPPVGYILGNVDFKDLFISLSGDDYPSLQAAQDAGAATINYGQFLNVVINFLIVAFVIFMVVKTFNTMQERFKRKEAAAPEAPKEPDTQEKLVAVLERLEKVLQEKS